MVSGFSDCVGLALAEGFAGAQQTTKVPRIGYLGLDDPSSSFFKSFHQGLPELGYLEKVEHKDLTLAQGMLRVGYFRSVALPKRSAARSLTS